MQRASLVPKAHIFVCANHRDESNPLGPGCGDRGEALFNELKREVAKRGALATLWVTKTHCLGICPKQGAACALYPKQLIITEAEPSDASKLVNLLYGPQP